MSDLREIGVATSPAETATAFEARQVSLGLVRRIFTYVLYKGPFVRRALETVMFYFQMALLKFYKDPSTVRRIEQVYRETELLIQPLEAYQLYSLAKLQSRLNGDFAEVGVYRGGTAKLLCQAKGKCAFYGYDTFAGLPDVDDVDRMWGVQFFHNQQYRAPLSDAQAYLAEFDGVHLIKGRFPHECGEIPLTGFSLVHLDVDIYRSTIEALERLWPRLEPIPKPRRRCTQ